MRRRRGSPSTQRRKQLDGRRRACLSVWVREGEGQEGCGGGVGVVAVIHQDHQ